MNESKQGQQALMPLVPNKDMYLDMLTEDVALPSAYVYPMNQGRRLEHESERLEYNEQFYAQVAALSVGVPTDAIAEGIKKTLAHHKLHRKTKQEWNAERVRDFRVCKEDIVPKAKKAEDTMDLLDAIGGAASYSSFTDVPTDPIPFLRNYEYETFDDTLRHMNRKHVNYGSIRVLDMLGQLIGDSRLSDLIYQLRRCPLETLNLSQNNLSDKGMTQLSTCLRSLGSLQNLILQHNHITDAGVEALLQPNTYSPTLRKLDISCNAIGTRAAFALGRMFRPEMDKKCELDQLFLGGRLGKKGWGDEFIRILVNLLCKKGARPIRVLSYPQAAITSDGVRAVASLVVCATQLRTLNLTKNSLQEPSSRRFLRDSFRVSSSLKEVFVGGAGIKRHERAEMEYAAREPVTSVTWKEKVDLTYSAAKELNTCFKLGHALEVVITNNWQAAKPPLFPMLEPYVATKEDIVKATSNSDDARDDGNDLDKIASSVPIPVPLVFLTSNMRLQASLTTALRYVDITGNFITSLKRNFFMCLNWLKENVDAFKMSGDLRAAWKRFQSREGATGKKRDFLLATLEKWTSISLAKIMVGVDGKIRKVREKQAKGKKGPGGRVKKTGKINVESIAMCIEELHSSYIELADCLQMLIGVSFAVKLRYQEIQRKMLLGQEAFDNSKKGAVGKAASKVKDLDGLLPYASLLGFASLYIHYIYVAGPEEIERVKKSIVAFERDKKRQAEIAANDAKRSHLAGMKKVGARFRVLRPWEIEERNERLGFDPQERANEAARLAAEIKEREEKEAAERAEALRIRAEEEAGGAGEDSAMEDEDTEEEEEEEEEDEEKEKKSHKVVRERTRFMVPKRELQKKYSDLFVEDLAADKIGTKNGVVMFARSNRSHVVTAIPFHLEMPSEDYTRKVPVDILLEMEEERADPLLPLARLDCIRPFVRLQERIRHKKAMNKFIREEMLEDM